MNWGPLLLQEVSHMNKFSLSDFFYIPGGRILEEHLLPTTVGSLVLVEEG